MRYRPVIDFYRLLTYIGVLFLILVASEICSVLLYQEVKTRKRTQQEILINQKRLLRSERHVAVGRAVSGILAGINQPLVVAVKDAAIVEKSLNSLVDVTESHHERQRLISRAAAGNADLISRLHRMASLLGCFKHLRLKETEADSVDYKIHHCINEVLMLHKDSLSKAGVTHTVDCPEHLVFRLNDGIILEIFNRLLENTMVHGLEGRDGVQIVISVRSHPHALHLGYEDNGAGEDIQKIRDLLESPELRPRERAAQGIPEGTGLRVCAVLVREIPDGSMEAYVPEGGALGFRMMVSSTLAPARGYISGHRTRERLKRKSRRAAAPAKGGGEGARELERAGGGWMPPEELQRKARLGGAVKNLKKVCAAPPNPPPNRRFPTGRGSFPGRGACQRRA